MSYTCAMIILVSRTGNWGHLGVALRLNYAFSHYGLVVVVMENLPKRLCLSSSYTRFSFGNPYTPIWYTQSLLRPPPPPPLPAPQSSFPLYIQWTGAVQSPPPPPPTAKFTRCRVIGKEKKLDATTHTWHALPRKETRLILSYLWGLITLWDANKQPQMVPWPRLENITEVITRYKAW